MGQSRAVLVGIFLLGGFFLFAVGLFLIGDRRQLFSESVELYAEYSRVSGLQPGAPVRVGGLDAGEVLEIQVPPRPESKFRIKFRVLEKFEPVLRADSVATIQTDGIVGNKFLQVDAGSASAEPVSNGSTIKSREPYDFADLMQQVSDTVTAVDETVDEVKGDFEETFTKLSGAATRAQTLIDDISDEVKDVAASGRQISSDIEAVTADVKAGRGTVGKLFNDDEIYHKLRTSVDGIQATVRNARQSSDDVKSMIGDFKSRGVVDDMEETVENVKEITAKAKKALDDIQPSEGSGLAADLRLTLDGARETMEDFSENAEALKRNWFFRGFFKDRGFYDLDSISIEEYKQGSGAPGYPRKRVWLSAWKLFSVDSTGAETLTESGEKAINEAMAELVPYAKDQPIIVEGYAGSGSPGDQFTRSHNRATMVREYLVKEFFLKPNYVGVIQMGAVQPEASVGKSWEGVSLVLYSSTPEQQPD